jgi:hypothetical protein
MTPPLSTFIARARELPITYGRLCTAWGGLCPEGAPCEGHATLGKALREAFEEGQLFAGDGKPVRSFAPRD